MIIGGGENVRIKEIKGYKGNTDGFARLYAAIWSQAVEGEEIEQRFRLFCDVVEGVFGEILQCYPWDRKNTLPKIKRIIIKKYGRAGERAVKNIVASINEHRKPLLSAVRDKIYRETLNWPDNPKGRKDKQFEAEYKKIFDTVLSTSGGFLKAVSG